MAVASSEAIRGTSLEPPRVREKDRWFNESRRGCEILITYSDGSTRTTIRARGWSEWIKQRILQSERSAVSAELVRPLSRDEYLAIRKMHRGQHKIVVAHQPPTRVEPTMPYGWEVLISEKGKTRMTLVACPTEDGAVQLMMALDGVDAAAAIRPLTFEEYRESARDSRAG